MMMSDDPWRDIAAPPSEASRINARRIPHSATWALYWAVDSDHKLLLILQYSGAIECLGRLPKVRGLRVEMQPSDNGRDRRILIRLIDPEQREIFFRFCRDVVDATCLAQTEEQAVRRFLDRTWRWHRLLQGGRDERLSDDQQRGLIGELIVLEEHLLSVLSPQVAVRSWTGPLDHPHDFEISQIHIEAKAQGTSRPSVTISSEHQLDSVNIDKLFFHVTEVTSGAEGTPDMLTVYDIANRIRSTLALHDIGAVDLFETLLDSVGFDWTHDYSDRPWVIGKKSLYEVRERFPRITSEMVSRGIGNVRYLLFLAECEPYRVDSIDLVNAISGVLDDS